MEDHSNNEEFLLSIAKRFKDLRELIKLTQENVYNDTSVHISRIESGKTNITLLTLKNLCDYFKITIPEFFRSC
ncbi:hypothetical protein APR41_04585 [Salegentibacter salinarum]|uniref:HTH cro/C1-type domain-containing protein n=1 Tax=Salegentibacter salinarum TaxID=447422 RepID=A0A2N0TUK6_9FLAO|nr:hypothetical protein APR41_04585 [Salegentibacter salinarum]SKB45765.1 Helix-turn-helix domain-containing protein [Salegentibacter salinarum]